MLALQIAKSCSYSQRTLDLFAEHGEAGNAASLLIQCKYIVLSNPHFLFAMANSREESYWNFLLLLAQAVWALLECISCLTPAL